jgi:DNA-binding transcriptional MocR family regulator
LPLIEDDVYHELYFDQRPASTKAFDRDGWVLHCSSFSKTLAPGYRIGWVSAGRFAREVAQQKLGASLATSIPVQLALASYLERGSYDRHLRGLRARLRTQRDAYSMLISEAFPAGTCVAEPEGGYFLWVELPEGCDALALAQRAMAEGISVSPGPIFSPAGAFRNCVRVNFGHPLDVRVAEAVRRVGDFARD